MQKSAISQAALLGRINRKLAREGERLRTARGERARCSVGDYYITTDRNWLVATHIEPKTLGREIGVLRAEEEVR